MRRNKRNRKNDVLIDLTSMLDVIFIVLLVVMVGQKTVSTISQNQLTAQQQSADEALTDLQNAKSLYDTAVDAARYFKSVSVAVPYEPNEVHKREIQFLFFGEKDTETITLIGNDTEKAMQQCKEKLEQYINRNEESPIILSLNDDDDKILFRDEKMITELLNELSAKYENVYIKGNLSEVEP